MTTEKVIKELTIKLKNPEYREGWVANIAMAYKDNEHWYRKKTGKHYLNTEDKHIIANDAAEYFIKQICGEFQVPAGR